VKNDVDLKLLLKRGALLAAANWPIVAIQFAAQTTFQGLLAVPIVGAAVLVAALVGDDVSTFLQGGIREMFAAIADRLMAEPAALAAFVVAFGIVLVGGSVFMFLVKGGTVTVLIAAHDASGPIEREPLTLGLLKRSARFTLGRYVDGCSRLFRRYLVLGLILIVVYALSAGGYLAFIALGYRGVSGGALLIAWTFVAALAAGVLVVWITAVNLIYLLVQIAIAAGDLTLVDAVRAVARFIRVEFRDLGGVFLVVLAMVIAATFASALAWSGVALIAFVPLIGLAVVPLQLAALFLRGILFEYIGLTALGAYVTLYRRHLVGTVDSAAREGIRRDAGPLNAWG
jgi:hypothetical protein